MRFDVRAWAESRRLSPTDIDGRWYWLPDETPTCLWFDAGAVAYETAELAWTALEESFATVVADLQITNLAIDACIQAIEAYTEKLPDTTKKNDFTIAGMILKRLKDQS